MFRFSISAPNGTPVEVTIPSSWHEAAKADYNGDPSSVRAVKNYIQSNGYTPFGVLATNPDRIAPQSVHYTFTTTDAFSLEILAGTPGNYKNELRPKTNNTQDIVLDDASTPSLRDRLKAVTSMAELKTVFWEALNAAEAAKDDGSSKKRLNDGFQNPEFGLKAFGQKNRKTLNDKARDIVNSVNDPAELSDEQREILVQYSGRGGLDGEIDGQQSEYYTPTPIAEGLWDMLEENGFANGNMLEPSAGSGVFSATKRPGTIMTAVELDPTSSGVNALLHPDEDNINAAFEEVCTRTEDNTYDSVIGNVPFGKGRTTAHLDNDPAYRNEQYIERYFIHRAIDKVKHGGLIALIVPHRVISGEGSFIKFRRAISYKAEFLGGVRLPEETFGDKNAQGTSTVTDVILLQKHPEELFNKINDLSEDTLKETNVLYEKFIRGKWFEGSGSRWIAGAEGGGWGGRIAVKAGNELKGRDNRPALLKSLRKTLAQRFDSRIDWASLEAAEPSPKLYQDGDRRFISDREYELKDGEWELVDIKTETAGGISADEYGADSIEGIRSNLSNLQATLELSYDQLGAIKSKYPRLLSDNQKDAIYFASLQPESERSLALRGVLVGQQIADIRERNNSGQDVSAELAESRQLVERLHSKYGDPRKHRKIKIRGQGSHYFNEFANAKTPAGEFNDFLSGEMTLDSAAGFNATNVQSIAEYLFSIAGERPVTVEKIAELYEGNKTLKSIGDVAEFEGISITPEGLVLPDAHYLAGNVYEKIDQLNLAAASSDDPRLQKKLLDQIEQLKSLREYEKLSDLRITIADNWVDKQYVIEFLEELGYDDLKYTITEDQFDENGNVTGQTEIDDTSRMGGRFSGLKKTGFPNQIMNYLNGEPIRGKVAEHRANLASLNEQFALWLQQHPDSEEVEEQYNRLYHSEIQKQYSSDNLEIEGLTDGVKLHDYQCQAVRQLSEEGRGILAHGVGLGKTFTALALAQYNQQMGRANRTCTVVPKSVLTNWYHEARALYKSMDGVLIVGVSPELGEDGQPVQEPVIENGEHKKNKITGELMYRDKLKKDGPEVIQQKLWSIPSSSAIKSVIMTSPLFGRIPVKVDTVEQYAGDWVSKNLIKEKNAEKYLSSKNFKNEASVTTSESSGSGWREAAKRARLNQKYRDEGTGKDSALPYYEDMGFDSVIVDEAHEFKNVYNGGRASGRIAYLSNPSVSNRATDMAVKMAHLKGKNNGRGAVMLSATPITNSPLEVYNALSLVSDIEVFERMGIANPDDFIQMFGKTESRDRENIKGKIESVEALVGFSNLGALRDIYYRYVNQKTAKDVFSNAKQDRSAPKAVESREFVELNNDEQAQFEMLREEAREAVFSNDEDSKKGRPVFSIMRDMERLMTDMDLFHKQITFRFPAGTKKAVAAMVKALPKEVTGKRFDDVENKEVKVTIKKKAKVNDLGGMVELVIQQEYESHIEQAIGDSADLDIGQVTHPGNPKYNKLAANVKKHLADNGKQIIFTEEINQHHRLARFLAHNTDGLEVNQIGFINGTDTAKEPQLQDAVNKFNQGETRVIICNKKAEVGINLQMGTTAIHHTSLPWNPASVEQRNGRAVRQGNTAEEVAVYYYLARSQYGQSMDERRLDILQRKADWLDRLMNGDEKEAGNAEAQSEDINEYDDLLEDDPELVAQRRAARIAKAQAQRAKQERDRAYSELSGLVKTQAALMEMSDHALITNVRRESEQLESALNRGKFFDASYRHLEYADNPKVEVRDRKRLEQLKKHLSRLTDKDRQRKLNSKLKQAKSNLMNIKSRGNLPFDEALINTPDQVYNIPGTQVFVAKGQYWEYKWSLFQVSEIDNISRKIRLQTIAGSAYGAQDDLNLKRGGRTQIDNGLWHIPFGVYPYDRMNLTNCTADEVKIKQLQGRTDIRYTELPSMDREMFLAHGHKGVFYDHANPALYRDEKGVLFIESNPELASFDRLVWPDLQDEKLKKEVADILIEKMRGDGLNGYSDKILKLFFTGKEEVQGYGKQAVELDVKSAAMKAWEAHKAEHTDIDWNDPESVDGKRFGFSNEYTLLSPMEKSATDQGDNIIQIKKWVGEVYQSLKTEHRKKMEVIEAEKKRKNAAILEGKRQTALKVESLPVFDEENPQHVEDLKRAVSPEQWGENLWALRSLYTDQVRDGQFSEAEYITLGKNRKPNSHAYTSRTFATEDEAKQYANSDPSMILYQTGFSERNKPVQFGKHISEIGVKTEVSDEKLLELIRQNRADSNGVTYPARVLIALEDEYLVSEDRIIAAVKQSDDMMIGSDGMIVDKVEELPEATREQVIATAVALAVERGDSIRATDVRHKLRDSHQLESFRSDIREALDEHPDFEKVSGSYYHYNGNASEEPAIDLPDDSDARKPAKAGFLSDAQIGSLADMKITARVVDSPVSWSKVKKFKRKGEWKSKKQQGSVPAGSIFLESQDGFDGRTAKLFKDNKESKAKWSAQFIQDPTPELIGKWWVVGKSDADIDQLIEELRAA
ncbi:helicase-related protein [Endozoicomonas lisbonensis]|uniref:N12 class adenine-specific DNA methylase n=1 Tax=Endozoicomonas lisbonensis TaxID=3120522 RepID=A0ABV2SQG5_9GAMM